MRNPTLVSVQVSVSALSLELASGAAAALGLGGMRAQSALNQPFYAEIDLFDIKSDELDTVKVRLASREDFSQAGAERPHFLTRLNFTPMIGPSGRPIVQITSREPIREPYLDFLVEVLWPQGRLVKEYTVLMDPPVSGGRAAPRVAQPQVTAPVRRSPPQSVRRAERPDPPPQRSAPRPASRSASDQQSAPPAPAAPAKAPSVAKPPPVSRQETASFPLRYGPVARGSGLWKIARRMALPDATLAQTAMALYRNNQDAFVGGNINVLQVGADLVIPTVEELFALDADSAEKQFQDALAGRSVTSKPITAIPEQPELRIATAGAEDGADSGAPPQKIGELEEDLLLVRETSETNRQETTELRDRIRELEGQLGDIRRLLDLRNEQLAQLQLAGRDPAVADGAVGLDLPGLDAVEQAAVGNLAASDAAPTSPLPAAVPVGDDAGRELLPNRPIDSDGDVAEDRSDPIEQAELPVEQTEVLAEEVSEVSTDAGTAALDAPTEKTTDTVAEVPDVGEEPSPTDFDLFGFLEPVTDAVPPWALTSGLGAVMIGGLGVLVYRRRRRIEDLEPDAMRFDFDPAADEAQQCGEFAKPTAKVPSKPESGADSEFGLGVQSVRSSDEVASSEAFLSDETLSLDLDSLPESELDMGASLPPAESGPAVDSATGLPRNVASNVERTRSSANPASQEADVLAEAEIYILYGRYREAERILLDELGRSPGRVGLRYKLAEAYIGSENRDALTALMAEMESAGEDQDDSVRWFTMRQELARMRPASDTDDRSPAAGNIGVSGPLVAKPPLTQPPVAQASAAEPESHKTTVDLDASHVDLDANDVDSLGNADFAETEDAGLGFSAREVEPSRADELQEQMEELELDLRDLDMLGDLRADTPSVTAQPPVDAGVAAPTLGMPAAEAATRSAPSERDVAMELGDDLDLDLDALDQLASVDHRDALPDSPMPDLHSLGHGMDTDAIKTPRPNLPLEPESTSAPIFGTEPHVGGPDRG